MIKLKNRQYRVLVTDRYRFNCIINVQNNLWGNHWRYMNRPTKELLCITLAIIFRHFQGPTQAVRNQYFMSSRNQKLIYGDWKLETMWSYYNSIDATQKLFGNVKHEVSKGNLIFQTIRTMKIVLLLHVHVIMRQQKNKSPAIVPDVTSQTSFINNTYSRCYGWHKEVKTFRLITPPECKH